MNHTIYVSLSKKLDNMKKIYYDKFCHDNSNKLLDSSKEKE